MKITIEFDIDNEAEISEEEIYKAIIEQIDNYIYTDNNEVFKIDSMKLSYHLL